MTGVGGDDSSMRSFLFYFIFLNVVLQLPGGICANSFNFLGERRVGKKEEIFFYLFISETFAS